MNGLPISDRERWLLQACLRDGADVRQAFEAWRAVAEIDDIHEPESPRRAEQDAEVFPETEIFLGIGVGGSVAHRKESCGEA